MSFDAVGTDTSDQWLSVEEIAEYHGLRPSRRLGAIRQDVEKNRMMRRADDWEERHRAKFALADHGNHE